MYVLRRDPAGGEEAGTALEQAALLARRHDMPRIEVLATQEMVRRFGGDEQRRARLAELFALHTALRETETEEHGGFIQ